MDLLCKRGKGGVSIFSVIRSHNCWTFGNVGAFRPEGQANALYSELSVFTPIQRLKEQFDALPSVEPRVITIGDHDKNTGKLEKGRNKYIAANKDPILCMIASIGMAFYAEFSFRNRKVLL
jgi:hypothetical protein